MDWKLFVQLVVTVGVALAGGWLGHHFSAQRDLANERRKLRVTYLLEAYRRLEDGGNRSDPDRSWPKFESAIADIQLLGTAHQVSLARQFARGMAQDSTASLDALINDLRKSLREELHLPRVDEAVIYLRFTQDGAPRFDQTLTATAREVDNAKIESAAIATPEKLSLIEGKEPINTSAAQIAQRWSELEKQLRDRMARIGVPTAGLGATSLLNVALDRGVITGIQQRSLRGLNAMRNLAIHGPRDEVDDERAREFLVLADAIAAVLDITPLPND